MVTKCWLCSNLDQKDTQKMETVYQKVPHFCLEVSVVIALEC